MAFPQTVLPIVTEMLIDGAWVDVTDDVRRDDGNGIRIARRPLSWGESNAPSTAAHTFENLTKNYSWRNPASTNFGKLGKNTQIRHRLRRVYDTFNRNTSNGFGSDESGQGNTWTTTGGSASDYSVSTSAPGGAMAGILFSAAGTRKGAETGPVLLDCRIVGQVKPGVVATGAQIDQGFSLRHDDGVDTHYEVLVRFETAATMRVRINRNIAGSATNVAEAVISGAYSSSTFMWIMADIEDNRIRMKAANTGSATLVELEALDWQLEYTDTSASAILSAGQMGGPVARVQSGNTNVPVTLYWNQIDVSDYRFWGEIPSWTPQQDSTGNDRYVPVIAAGLGQRLSAGGQARPLGSAMTRAMDGVGDGDVEPVAHWNLEDPSGTTRPGNLRDGGAATVTGAVDMAGYTYSGPFGSTAVPAIGAGGQIAGTYPPTVLEVDGSGRSIWQVQFMGVIPSTMSANTQFFDVNVPDTGGDHVIKWRIDWDNGFKILTARPYNTSGAALTGVALDFGANPSFYDRPVLFGLSVYQTSVGGLVSQQFAGRYPGVSGLVSSNVIGTTTIIPVPQSWRAYANSVNAGWSFSHHALYTDPALFDTPNQQNNADALDGYAGELSGDRMTRLSQEEDVPFEIIGDAADTHPCGSQTTGTYLDNMREAADADQGVLFEPRNSLSLAYRTRTSLYNTTSRVSLSKDGSTKHLSRFKFDDDDKTVRNLIIARRIGGSFAVAEVTEGRTSTADPPDGIGTYPEDLSWNVAADDELPAFAGWRAHRLSWDAPRIQLGVERERSAISGTAAIDAGVLALDLASHFTVTDPGDDLAPDDIRLLVQGYDETLANFEHKITNVNTYPQDPYRVFVLDSTTLGRLEGDQALLTAVNSSATSWDVATLSGPVLVTTDADDGMQWMIDGELVTVTDVAPATVGFVGVGTASTGSSGSRTPGLPASVAIGNLMLVFASTRNSGTGVPQLVANWDQIYLDGNIALYAKIYAGGGAGEMPTITYSGGAANEDTIAQSMALSGKFSNTDRIVVAYAGRLNASAVDIISAGIPTNLLPDNLMAINFAWKQDNFTSSAAAASWTKAQESSSTAGNDAGQCWSYRQFTTKPTAGQLQPTTTDSGGAAAISRGGVILIASDYQTVTVTRSVNGVSMSHDAGAVPRLYPAPHLAL